MNDVSNTPQSYMDFSGLGNLRGQAQQKSEKATRDTATQFEAMMIQMMLKSMREATDKSELTSSDTADTYEQMYDRELSMQLAKRNTMGVADMIVRHVEGANAAAATTRAMAEKNRDEEQKPLPLNPAKEGMTLQGQNALPLVRPEKFMVKPANALGGLKLGGAMGADK